MQTTQTRSRGITLAPICVSCPHSQSGFCGALFASEADHSLGWQRFTVVSAGDQLIVQNRTSDDVFVLCSGWAFRYFQLSDGRRQILKFLLPGDLFSTTSVFEERFHFAVKALTDVQVSAIRRTEVQARLSVNPGILSALANSCLIEARAADEMLTALGQYSAERRIAHLLLRITQKIAARNIIREQRYPFPLRHQHIADTVGLTPVHVSRVMSMLRSRGVVELSDGILQVSDPCELQRMGSLK